MKTERWIVQVRHEVTEGDEVTTTQRSLIVGPPIGVEPPLHEVERVAGLCFEQVRMHLADLEYPRIAAKADAIETADRS